MIKKLRNRLSKSFTDSLYFVNLILAWLFTIWCSLLTVYGDNWGVQDYSVIIYGMPLVFTELSVHTAFIISKAKAENLNMHCKEEEDEYDM